MLNAESFEVLYVKLKAANPNTANFLSFLLFYSTQYIYYITPLSPLSQAECCKVRHNLKTTGVPNEI